MIWLQTGSLSLNARVDMGRVLLVTFFLGRRLPFSVHFVIMCFFVPFAGHGRFGRLFSPFASKAGGLGRNSISEEQTIRN